MRYRYDGEEWMNVVFFIVGMVIILYGIYWYFIRKDKDNEDNKKDS